MQVTLQYFDGCPNWKVTRSHLKSLQAQGLDLEVVLQIVETPEEAEKAQFRGSPTVVIDGVDPFAEPDAPVGLSCRTYLTDAGRAGSPTLEQLREAIAASGY